MNSRTARVGWCVRLLLVLLLLPSVPYAQGTVAVCGDGGVVATSQPLASEAAIEILRMGGNAVDAAVAAAFTLCAVEPHASGVGGGGGVVIYLRDERAAHFVNYYGCAPERCDELSGYDREGYRHTAKSILVPGTVAGLTLALERFGTMDLADVIAPAIRYARGGFEIDETLGRIILDNAEILGYDENTAAVFLEMDFPRVAGDTLRQPELAETLELIASRGREGFYEGSVAERLVAGIAERGGLLTLDDFERYRAEVSEPLYGSYRGYTIVTAGLPLSGASIIEALNILENVDLKSMGHYTSSPRTLHLIAETFRRVYADRSGFLGDPSYNYIPVNGVISKAYAETRYHEINHFTVDPPRYRDTPAGNPARFDDEPVGRRIGERAVRDDEDPDDIDRFGRSSYDTWGEDRFDSFGASKKKSKKKSADDGGSDGESKRDSHGEGNEGEAHTTHLSVIDADGNAVALTQTLGTFFGSTRTVAGILLNCGMSNFSTTSQPNLFEPGKRPRSSISPTVVLENETPVLIVGTPGASRIISTVVELLINVLDFDMDAAEANSAPRFYTSKFSDYLYIEGGISEPVLDKLERLGHPLRVYSGIDIFFGGANMIRVDTESGLRCGSSDPRRSGAAMSD